MDRSFLSDQAVIAATRAFVCVRAATYEIEEEVPFLNSLFRGRSAELENTVFSLLAPDGHTQISRGGRGPQMAFRTDDNKQIISELEKASAKYKLKTPAAAQTLPFAKDARMGLNVAACDNQALILCLAETPASLTNIETALAEHAWGESYIGKFHYASSNKTELQKLVTGLTIDSGIVIVQPDRFGTKAIVLVEHSLGDSSKKLSETLDTALVKFDRKPADDTRTHVRAGKSSGAHWETATPVTDQGGPRRERGPAPR